MRKVALVGALAASALSMVSPVAHADRAEPPPLYGYYNAFIDFSRQTFNGMPTPMNPITVLVRFSTQCDVTGCVARWHNETENVRNPNAPSAFDYKWNNGRWETSAEYPYLCDRNNPGSAVKSQRSDYLIPNPDGSFFGERTLDIDGAGCPGEGPGTHWLPISLTPTDPPPPG